MDMKTSNCLLTNKLMLRFQYLCVTLNLNVYIVYNAYFESLLTNKLMLRFQRKELRSLRKSWKIVVVSENDKFTFTCKHTEKA